MTKRKRNPHPLSKWPTDKKTVAIEVFLPPDRDGKHGLEAFWWNGESPQYSTWRANLAEFKQRWARKGWQVEVRP